MSDMKRVSTMLAMLAASEAMPRSYDYEYRGSDLLIRKKRENKDGDCRKRSSHYTVDSPEVKRMSK